MCNIKKKALLAALIGLVVLACASIVIAAAITSRETTINGKKTGEVLVDEKVVIRFRTESGGLSPYERAMITAGRLDKALEASDDPSQFAAKSIDSEHGVYAGDTLIVRVTAADADASSTNTGALATAWRDNIIKALGGTPPPPEPPPSPQEAQEPAQPAAPEYADWEGHDTKWVPILDVQNHAVRIGAAQVAGPKVQVEKTKAVAQLELKFKNVARTKVYVPIDSYDIIALNRVQGVSVWAVGDVRIVKF